MRVLVVDDNVEIREILTKMLAFLGYKTNGAKDSFEAIRILENDHYDVVITDGEMPKMTGFELARFIKKKYPHIFIVGLSGSSECEKFKFAGADVYFNKPVDLPKLHMAIKNKGLRVTTNT
ncbi:MAG TPA: response regulator [Candidatus Desulfofervidus auxilii]|uniref:Response regulator n=1 Tax=Desulfofervidus auxilii TaxID=1621989 RepID=A0A7C0U2C3_DESA2|nr:response regulator [Candidatus Desulfofervidus auxilii]